MSGLDCRHDIVFDERPNGIRPVRIYWVCRRCHRQGVVIFPARTGTYDHEMSYTGRDGMPRRREPVPTESDDPREWVEACLDNNRSCFNHVGSSAVVAELSIAMLDLAKNYMAAEAHRIRDRAVEEYARKERERENAVADAKRDRRAGARVYAIRNMRSGHIKIGVATDPIQRLASLQTATVDQLELLVTVEGGVALERELHERFGAERLSGEWFDPAAALLAWIEEARR